MIANREEIKKIIITVCDRDFITLEKLNEIEDLFVYEGIDLTGTDTIDSISYIHRYTAEEYIMMAKEQLEKIKNIEDKSLKEKIKEIIYNIVPIDDFLSFEHNSKGYKDLEHYFDIKDITRYVWSTTKEVWCHFVCDSIEECIKDAKTLGHPDITYLWVGKLGKNNKIYDIERVNVNVGEKK